MNVHRSASNDNNNINNLVSVSAAPPATITGTLAFHDATPGSKAEIRSSLESTYSHGGTSDVPLAEFLKRPVLLDTYPWTLGPNFNRVINPWTLFLNHTNIRKRLENYRYVRGHLKIRVVVTGNPLLYGQVLIAYEPWANRSVFTDYGSTLGKVHKGVLSQMPHIVLDATTSQGGEMTLPFFSPYNWLDLTAEGMSDDMGKLYATNITTLNHATATSGSMEYQIYAWMEDAEITVPTHADYGTESYQGGDEFHSGLISKPASAISRVAGVLAKVPIFRPYALATQVAADTTAGVASAFGYSRPTVIDNITPTREYEAGSFASTNAHEAVNRLSLDTKGQLTVDSRTVGLDGQDEMSLKHILTRETLQNAFYWNEAKVAGDRLFSLRVTPTYHSLDTTSVPSRNLIPPCTAVASMFRFWRGTMVYRFTIVASAFHRGKLRITYEPTSSLTVGSVSSAYNRIIDLAETRDFEIPVHWHQPTPWQQVKLSSIGDATDKHYSDATLPAVSGAENYFNGVLTVSVLTPLTSPDPTLAQSVTILYRVRGGEDLEFADPVADELPFTYRSTDITETPQGSTDEELDGAPDLPPGSAQEIAPSMGQPGDETDYLAHVFHGESVASIRSFLRRYRRTSRTLHTDTITNMPLVNYPVRDSVAVDYMSILEFVMGWYVGWRGSTRLKTTCGRGEGGVFISRAKRGQPATYNGHAGAHYNRGTAEVENPYHSYRRFSFCRTSPGWANNTEGIGADPNYDAFQIDKTFASSTDTNVSLIRSVQLMATGEDFSLFFFLGIPPVYAI